MAIACQAGPLCHAQRLRQRMSVLGLADQSGFVEVPQGKIAALACALGIAARIVPGRSLDESDQQGDLRNAQLAQITREVELGCRRRAVYRLPALLAHEDV